MSELLDLMRERLRSYDGRVDLLSDAIAAVRIGQPTSNRLRAGDGWCYRFAPYEGAGFHVLLRGSGWLVPDEGEPVPLGAGDVVLVPHGSAHTLSATPDATGAVPFETAVPEPAGRTEFLCGKYRLDHARQHPVLADLPEVVHLPAPDRPAPRTPGGDRPARRGGDRAAAGQATVLTGLLDLLLVYLIRAWLDGNPAHGLAAGPA